MVIQKEYRYFIFVTPFEKHVNEDHVTKDVCMK